MTGGIACGKTLVARLLAEKGCVVRSADETARALMSPGRAAWKRIVARFGPSILKPDRTIDRARLGPLVFADPSARRFLDRVVHPLVLAEHLRAVRRLEREGRSAIFVVEAALTVEAGFTRHFDRVVVVHCRKEDQVRRLRSRDGLTRAEALRRIGAQMPLREKLRHADYALDASGTVAETVERAERLYALLALDADLERAA